MTGLDIKPSDWLSLVTCLIFQHRLLKSVAMYRCQAVDVTLLA